MAREVTKDGEKSERISCRGCGSQLMPVLYTRHINGATYRVRQCAHCKRRIMTRESEVGAGK